MALGARPRQREASRSAAPDAPAAGDTPAIAARLRLSTTRLARQLRREADAALTPSQQSALATVERNGPLTLGTLAELERVAPPSVTKVVAKLEAAGLVSRRLDERDRRVAWITVTAAGAQRLAQVRQRKNAWLAAQVRKLDDDQRRRLADALDVLDELAGDSP